MRQLVKIRNYLLVSAAVIVLAAIPLSERLHFDQTIESFFAADNPDLVILKRSRRDFGGDEFVIVAWSEPRLFDVPDETYPSSLEDVLKVDVLPAVNEDVSTRIRQNAERLSSVPGVNGKQTQHLADLLAAAPRYKPTRRSMLRMFEGTLVGQDGRTTGIMLELQPEQAAEISRAETLARIREIAADMQGDVAVAGEPVQVYDMFRLVEEDARVLFLVSLVILAIVLWVLFRGLRWVLAPVGLVLGSVVVTRAILALVGAELSMVSSMLSSLVTVIGIATSMHVIVHYRDLRNSLLLNDPEATGPAGDFPAIATQTLREMAAPICWTCLTTAVGFASLLVSQITPVRSFSVMMSLATGVVMVACFVVLPATLASGSRLKVPSRVPLESWLDRALLLNCRTVEQRPMITGIVCAALFVVAIPGVFRLQLETDFSRNFKKSSTIVQALEFIETRLGGAGSWEVSFDTPEKLTDSFLRDIQRLTDQLHELTDDDPTIRILSLTDVADLPPRLFGPAKSLARIERKQPMLVRNFYNKDANRMRIVLRSVEQQSSERKIAQIEEIRSCVQQFFDKRPDLEQSVPPSASGMFVLLAELIQSLLSDQLKSFVVASSGILICMAIAFRSLRIAVLSLLPNMFPVAIVMGALGWIGMPVNIGTAMITSVSMGLTVDSTIHYITAFERARQNCSVTEALHVAHAGAGRAVVFAHCALVAGFLVLTAARFIPLVYFGALLSLALVGGVFGDLVLLPLLLRWTAPKDSANDADQACQSDVAAAELADSVD
ncbi:efflux RND transporter permease subunit [Fuerstiella marisgermanici]|uniref:Efflux transporter, putative, hydrophobe/amphiphile efflux-3 (HAE3) family n=1 Tax=Fuerstiella marisgermanici TaxID=1891926 RepID=A0A1P8WAR5_9PLAN|nr:MMPL family transporter [Fuerstiella marisgermanici]APZ91125.1 efflux transporter, putative, hydrophobe/amphiphile efflux-3 (HAE3) family [Fuerstiella marisgermanici]